MECKVSKIRNRDNFFFFFLGVGGGKTWQPRDTKERGLSIFGINNP